SWAHPGTPLVKATRGTATIANMPVSKDSMLLGSFRWGWSVGSAERRRARRSCVLRGTPGCPEDVWIGWQERRGAEGKALAGLDLKPCSLDTAGRVARQVTAARDMGPQGCVGESLQARLPRAMGDDMLIEAR